MCERDDVHASTVELDDTNGVFRQKWVEARSFDLFRKLSRAEAQLAGAALPADVDIVLLRRGLVDDGS